MLGSYHQSKIGEWYESTVLPQILKIEPKLLTRQRLQDNMDLIVEEDAEELQVSLAKKVVEL